MYGKKMYNLKYENKLQFIIKIKSKKFKKNIIFFAT